MKRTIGWIGIVLGVLIALPTAFWFLILDHRDEPWCHKAFYLALRSNESPAVYPNVSGSERSSIQVLTNDVGTHSKDWTQDYRYVPGLQDTDPGDLVLMYFNRPTRWIWHGSHPTRFKEKKWIIIPVDFADGGRGRQGPGEQSEWVSEEIFRQRLHKTLEFIRTNQRPHWETIVAEHTAFLESVGEPP
ncbi:MAG TPA: hypothetical protein DCY13_17240 [Verrucomicrobiales bacterium]|nr:hypothetical protein [Verrucomicrobiales bacterium]